MGRKNSKNAKPKKTHLDANTFLGILDVTRNGIGYVMVESQKKDVLVRPVDFNRAMHGDKVKVKVTKSNPRTGRVEGIVEEVLERKQSEFIGEIEVNRDFAFFLPDRSKPMPDIYIPLDKLNGATDGDRVVVRMTEWKKNSKNPHGEVISILDSSDVNDMAMKEILTEKGFPLVFPDDVMEETARIPDLIPTDEIKKRRDMRDVLTFTIDPVDARDFDDAISIHKQTNGLYEIGVHIADVSFYVEEGTELDEEAYRRATSVYLPDRVLPMLPERISNELCSLRPHEDKLTFSAIFQISAKGEIKGHWIGRTIIHSNHRYTYEDVQEIIEKEEGIYQQEIELLNNLAQKFRKQRFKEGAINFSSQEVRFKLDENAKPIGIVIKESKESHQLVEEFMLLANRVVAKEISGVMVKDTVLPFPYRIHDRPDEEKLIPFVDFAKKFGHKFDVKTPHGIAASFNKMLGEVRGTPQQHVLEQLGIRTMAKAIYSTDNIGHYGLAFEHYCHFTSPIRRYPDVLVHRIVQGVLEGKPHPDKKLEQKCRHCSERERAAMESERNANKYKQVEYMSDFIGEEFEGVISGVASFGFWVETVEHKCEGLVSIQSLYEYDEFRHVESDYCLVGKRSGRTFRMGDRVWIKVLSGNLQRRQLDYDWILVPSKEIIGEELPKRKNSKKKK